MSRDRPIYVFDTSALLSCVDVIPGEKDTWQPPTLTVNLDRAHAVIPYVVVCELSKLTRGKERRNRVAREALRRLMELQKDRKAHNLEDIYNLKAPIEVPEHDWWISILPVHQVFWKCLPFRPRDDDTDEQVILAAMAASLADQGKDVSGEELKGTSRHLLLDNVTLLTNDHGLTVRAQALGLVAKSFGCKSQG